MNCAWLQRNLRAYSERDLGFVDSTRARLHLLSCSECYEDYERWARVESPLRDLPPVSPPVELRLAIRLAAAREAARGSWAQAWLRDLRRRLDEAMEPLAVRAAGAALSAFFFFGALMPDLWTARRIGADDVPLTFLARKLVSAPTIVELAPYPISASIMVLASVDERGGIYDFEMPADQRDNVRLRAELANALLMTDVEPAMVFGKPVAGRVYISFTTYTVKG